MTFDAGAFLESLVWFDGRTLDDADITRMAEKAGFPEGSVVAWGGVPTERGYTPYPVRVLNGFSAGQCWILIDTREVTSNSYRVYQFYLLKDVHRAPTDANSFGGYLIDLEAPIGRKAEILDPETVTDIDYEILFYRPTQSGVRGRDDDDTSQFVGGVRIFVDGSGNMPGAGEYYSMRGEIELWYPGEDGWKAEGDPGSEPIEDDELTLWARGRSCEENAAIYSSLSYNPDSAYDYGDLTTFEENTGSAYWCLDWAVSQLAFRGFITDAQLPAVQELLYALSRLDYDDYLRACRDPIGTVGDTEPGTAEDVPL